MTTITRRRALALAASLPLSACSLPRGAPLKREIVRGGGGRDYAVVRVTRDTVGEIATWPRLGDPPNAGWLGRGDGAMTSLIAVGDRLDVQVWEASDNSLLTTPTQNVAALEGLIVDADGTIFLPYLGDVRVAGLSTDRARQRIQTEMTSVIPSAQVLLARLPGRLGSVDVVGGVQRPGRYPLLDRDTSLLNVISEAGGVPARLNNPLVRLVRDDAVYLTSLQRLYDTPGFDTILQGGDKVIVAADQRYFIALGAAGRETVVEFPRDRLTAIEALSLAGGLSDSRADPRGLLIMRTYPDAALLRRSGPDHGRVVFAIDLTSADGIFSAEQFEIRPGDVVLVTESPVTSTQTIFSIIGSAFGLAARIDDV